MVERCVESVPERRLRHAVDDDSFGFTRMFRDYTFTLELEPRGAATLVTIETFYEPRGPMSRLLNATLMRRRFKSVRQEILDGLRDYVELRGRDPGVADPPDVAVVGAAAAAEHVQLR